jgi:hypothetical protein
MGGHQPTNRGHTLNPDSTTYPVTSLLPFSRLLFLLVENVIVESASKCQCEEYILAVFPSFLAVD